MNRDLAGQVMTVTVAAALALAGAAGVVAGGRAALGVAAGAAISLLSFRGLARGAAGATGRPVVLAIGGLGLRYLISFGLIALVLASGAAHVVGVIVGLSVLPPVVIAVGLRAARLSA